jgi:hypothetical protein
MRNLLLEKVEGIINTKPYQYLILLFFTEKRCNEETFFIIVETA